jgi:emfourin
MRIIFKTEGGIVHLPGLSEPVTIDTEQLPAEQASELEQLIEAANFFELPTTSAPPPGAADYQQYTISVTTPGRSHEARLTDPIENPRVRELVNHLRTKTIEIRLASRRRDTS